MSSYVGCIEGAEDTSARKLVSLVINLNTLAVSKERFVVNTAELFCLPWCSITLKMAFLESAAAAAAAAHLCIPRKSSFLGDFWSKHPARSNVDPELPPCCFSRYSHPNSAEPSSAPSIDRWISDGPGVRFFERAYHSVSGFGWMTSECQGTPSSRILEASYIEKVRAR